MISCTSHEDRRTGPQNGRAVTEMLAAAFFFATMSCIAHGFREQIAWPLAALARIGITFGLVLVLAGISGAPLVVRGTKALWWRSLSGSVGLLCTFYAVTHLPVTDTVTIFATGPLWITVILATVFRQRMPARTWFYALAALAGVYIMYRPTFDADSFPLAVALFGSWAAAAAMVSISFCAELSALSVVAHYSACASLVCLGICIFMPTGLVLDGGVDARWWWLALMGAAGTLAQVLMTSAYGRGNTTVVALVGISQIAFAAIYDVLVWGHAFDLWEAVGVIIIAVSIASSILTTDTKAW